MNGSLIDTNVIIRLLNGNDSAVRLFSVSSNISISVIVVGELFYGAYKSSRTQENLNLFVDFLSNYPILSIDKNISQCYGIVKSQLIKDGFTLPENDIWIAATAKANNLTLITFDSHFSHVNGLNILA